MTEEQLANWRSGILYLESQWVSEHNLKSLILFLIWLYEFAESFAVNNTGEQAKLTRAKVRYSNGLFVMQLFHLRGELVHKPYNSGEQKIIDFYNSNPEEIKVLKRECGFEDLQLLQSCS